jgi:hypothetical protein
MLLPFEGAFHHVARSARSSLDPAAIARIKLLTVAFYQFRLVIESIALAGAAVHKELHDALDLGAMMDAAVQLRSRSGSRKSDVTDL